MPPSSRSVHSYTDIDQLFRKVLETGALRVSFATKQKRTAFSARANFYRVLLRDLEREAGRPAISPFDHLLIRMPKDELFCIVEPRGFDFLAVTDAEGNTVELSHATGDAATPLPHERTQIEDEEAAFLASFLSKREDE